VKRFPLLQHVEDEIEVDQIDEALDRQLRHRPCGAAVTPESRWAR
jgi:hypothetical protein